MATQINIGGDPNDSHYRYKRNIIEVSYTSKKGGMTKVTNFQRICKQLKVPFAEFSKGFYKKVKKTLGLNMVSQGVFKGKVTSDALEKILEKMIKKFILCKKCNLPELNAEGDCLACGRSQETKGEPVQAQSVAEITATVEVKYTGDLESKTTRFLHKVYALRDQCMEKDEDYTDLDRIIDCCWNVTNESQLKKLMNELTTQ
jgi:translation initiation factor 2 beta subunit (eIF-2beta)/eIF-5